MKNKFKKALPILLLLMVPLSIYAAMNWEEPKFYVLDKEDRPLLLRFSQGIMRAPSGLSPIDKIVKNQRNSMQFTEQEIKDCDERLWAFAVPVEELE